MVEGKKVKCPANSEESEVSREPENSEALREPEKSEALREPENNEAASNRKKKSLKSLERRVLRTKSLIDLKLNAGRRQPGCASMNEPGSRRCFGTDELFRRWRTTRF
jgi:hypothetical protein